MKKSIISRTRFALVLLGSTLLASQGHGGKVMDVFGNFALPDDHAHSASQKAHMASMAEAKSQRGDKGHGVDTSAGAFGAFVQKAAALAANDAVTTENILAKASKIGAQKNVVTLGKDFALESLRKAITDGIQGVEVKGKVNSAQFNKFVEAEMRRVTGTAENAAGNLEKALNGLSGAYKQLAPQSGGADALENLKGLDVIKMAHSFGMFKFFQADPTQVMADFGTNPEAAWVKYSRDSGTFKQNGAQIAAFVEAMNANAETLKDEAWQDKLEKDAGNFSYRIGGFDWNLFKSMEGVANASIQKRSALGAWDAANALVPGAIDAIRAKAEAINSGEALSPDSVSASAPAVGSASSNRLVVDSDEE